ncbi:MAG: DEAD/DEAH box helicase family protein [Desulfarculus sp.]|nr:DEAD/DEAH box helicase family protein [Pseudomonadota bacterium]MBU4599732.1 DEAD/DEAH box helicase family protein [Pseudomonadota bacterium]MBV1716150.1 DEAD/DEAH box helicase family protein [Desulfarculus sp.]MBV1737226.1 DEAD/DEAH box helicase family protein [Desulfarculus sp.]
MPVDHKEIALEAAIEDHLVNQAGYGKADPAAFDRERCLDPSLFLSFVQETQPKEWAYLAGIQKAKAEATLLDDLTSALNSEHQGCLNVLRHGFKCFGKLFRAAYFAPASGMNPETVARYKANRLTITRQLHYSPKHENSLDLVLSLNGIPVATAELKNPLSGQTWRNAVSQYKHDRDPQDLIFQFKRRALVHFAVDPDEVHMTTKLAKGHTVFLPFNLGDDTGAGNPVNPHGYRTSYLWERIWQRDSFLDILARFVHLEVEHKEVGKKKIKKETMIFPRFHQLDAVRKMVADAKEKETGHNYLVHHSAGSGKSNTIAWLAHRLATLHNDKDEKVFDSVVVITDRRVLDQQLQDTVYQFEHKQGVVEKIDVDSNQLAQALANGVPIIITTLQKFPFVTDKVGDLPSRKYAVLIDEAHSSQGGETATELKQVLAGEAIKEEAKKQAEEEGLPDYQEEILKAMAKRGKQPNISFFAFTATPKYKTLEVFGREGADGKPEPFHLYSMRQAIEEGFILDVLENYTTYKTFYRLVKAIEDDPEVDQKKAATALARFMSLHPYNIAQKTLVMVEHFRNTTHHKIGGRAKAMLVTSSRLHAVRYKLAFDKYIAEKGYTDIKTLVAFSGTVFDSDTKTEYTEVGMNSAIKERELPAYFASDEYQLLLVAEKYQTGFDQPLLHTMYVDKRLMGVHAVQTLSRLNRRRDGKKDTFVLDFVNEAEDILAAFQPYYERTLIGEQAEPKQLYEMQAKLDGWQVYYKAEVEEFAKVFFTPKHKQTKSDHAKMYACLDPAVGRYKELAEEEREEFRKTLVAFRNLYAFLSQVVPFQDMDLEKLYSYVRFLISKLPKREFGPSYHFDDEVDLQYYRLQKISEGAIKLEKQGGEEIKAPTSMGTGTAHDMKIGLSELIDRLNERFGTDFKPADQLFFDSIREDAVANDKLRQAALANTLENFGFVFLKELEDLFIDRMDQNEEITAKFINEKEFQKVVGQALLKEVYEQINAKGEGPVQQAQ